MNSRNSISNDNIDVSPDTVFGINDVGMKFIHTYILKVILAKTRYIRCSFILIIIDTF